MIQALWTTQRPSLQRRKGAPNMRNSLSLPVPRKSSVTVRRTTYTSEAHSQRDNCAERQHQYLRSIIESTERGREQSDGVSQLSHNTKSRMLRPGDGGSGVGGLKPVSHLRRHTCILRSDSHWTFDPPELFSNNISRALCASRARDPIRRACDPWRQLDVLVMVLNHVVEDETLQRGLHVGRPHQAVRGLDLLRHVEEKNCSVPHARQERISVVVKPPPMVYMDDIHTDRSPIGGTVAQFKR